MFGLQAFSHTPLYLDAYPTATFTGHLPVPAQVINQLSNHLFPEFQLGIGLAYLHANCSAQVVAVNEKIRGGVYLLLAAYFLSHFFSGYAMEHGLTRKGLAALALFTAYLCADFDGLLAQVKGFSRGPGGAFTFLCRISFSLYIVHEPLHQFIGSVPVLAELFRPEGGVGKFVTLGTFRWWPPMRFSIWLNSPRSASESMAERLVAVAREERPMATV